MILNNNSNSPRILIVEDEMIIAYNLARKLKTSGYEVLRIVSSADEAFYYSELEKPDIILMDIIIRGDINGVQAAIQIYNNLSIPIIFLTACADEKTLIHVEQAKAFGFILKPYKIEEVITVIRLAINKNRDIQRINLEATTDPLTGLLNRRSWDDLINQEFEKYQRYGMSFSLSILDIDYFKQINDNYGHSVGDEAIIHVAKVVKDVMRRSDVIGRFGGDEFVIMLPNTPLDVAVRQAERLSIEINTIEFWADKTRLDITLSIGVAEVSMYDKTFNAVLERSDKALYKAKVNGRNRVEYLKDPRKISLSEAIAVKQKP